MSLQNFYLRLNKTYNQSLIFLFTIHNLETPYQAFDYTLEEVGSVRFNKLNHSVLEIRIIIWTTPAQNALGKKERTEQPKFKE